MSFDLSRKTFDPLQDYLGVVMQQGSVQLDADWNELGAQLKRRIHAGSLDTFFEPVVPRVTPDGFLITGTPAAIDIGPGRIYVDGILAENHLENPAWEAKLAELSGQDPVAYDQQPYYPMPPVLPAEENYLVYVDVWQREITHLHDPDLVEKAVGVDSTGRMQTIWQVKALGGIGDLDPATPDEDIPNWLETIHPSSARLTTSTGELDDDPNPCLLPPQAGYKGLENQLYRIEVHNGGPVGDATFKWSRDNATVATRVTAIPTTNELIVESVGRDDNLRFNDGDWVEVTDEHRVLHGEPGELRRIQLGGGVDDATRTITLEGAALPLGAGTFDFAVDGNGQTTPQRHTIVRRWDQGGSIRREDGSEAQSLSVLGASGSIDIPAVGERLFLEHGILVEFDLAATGQPFAGEFRTGDYWLVAARASDASIELLDRAPPCGIHHHFAKLALVFPNEIIDCRTLWPPEPAGEGCACTVCVEPEGHNDGSATIQQAIDTVVAAGGGSVCLAVGQYLIRNPIRIAGNTLTLKGQGWQSILLAVEPIDLIQVGNEGLSTDITLADFLGVTTSTQGLNSCVEVQNVFGFRLENCLLANAAIGEGISQGVRMTGLIALADLVESEILAERGIVGPLSDDSFLATLDLMVRECIIGASETGIAFDGISLHLGRFGLHHNHINNARLGISLEGATFGKSMADLSHNLVTNCSTGIRCGFSQLRINLNEIDAATDTDLDGNGIELIEGLDPAAMQDVQIVGNRIRNQRRHGISVQGAVANLIVKQNQMRDLNGAAFIIEPTGSVTQLNLENNQLRRIRGFLPGLANQFAAVSVQASQTAEISNNLLQEVVASDSSASILAGIAITSSADVRITGNILRGVTAAAYQGVGTGIIVNSNVGLSQLQDNRISRQGEASQQPAPASWIPLVVLTQVATPATDATGAAGSIFGQLFSSSILATGTAYHRSPVVVSDRFAYVLSPSRLVNIGVRAAEDHSAMIGANQLDGSRSALPAAIVRVNQLCGFDGNQLWSDQVGLLAVVQAGQTRANNNHMHAPNDLDSMHIHSNRFVVMGNMSNGNIRVVINGQVQSLPEPWQALNIII